MRKIIVALLIGTMLASMLAVSAAAADRIVVKAPKIEVAPVIDGVITEDEWGKPFYSGETEGSDFFTGIGEEVKSSVYPANVDLYTRWDEDNLYIGAVVTENTYINNGVDAGGWAGDGMEIDIVGEGLDQAVRCRTNLSCNSKTGQVNGYYFHKINAAMDGKDDYIVAFGEENSTSGCAKAEGNVVTYEWAFGWEFTQQYSDIKEGFKCLVNYQFHCTDDGSDIQYLNYCNRDDQDAKQYPEVVLTAAPKVETEPVTQAAPTTGTTAPATFDVAVLAGVSAALAAAGVVVSKKRK